MYIRNNNKENTNISSVIWKRKKKNVTQAKSFFSEETEEHLQNENKVLFHLAWILLSFKMMPQVVSGHWKKISLWVKIFS